MKQGAGGKGAFLDRDGVLNIDHGYVSRTEDFVWVEGAVAALRRLKQAGYVVIVVTNQSGIGRGYYSEADMNALHAFMNVELARAGARIDAFYHCPFHPEAEIAAWRAADHPDRKPNPGMILRGLADFSLDPRKCFLIGDRESDIEAAQRAGIAACQFTGGNLDDVVATILSDQPS